MLVCPTCQAERPGWSEGLDRCARCGSTRLSVMLDEVICRQCGRVGALAPPDEPADRSPGA